MGEPTALQLGANRWNVALVSALAAATLLALALLWRFEPQGQIFFPRCTFHQVTGLLCPGCGGLRATHALLHGELLAAWRPESSWFWATHGGAELDLLVLRDGLKIGVEIKRADAPRLSASMRQALADLELDRLLVITPGERSYRLNERTQVLTLAEALGPVGPRPA
jgi:hypothetical protein